MGQANVGSGIVVAGGYGIELYVKGAYNFHRIICTYKPRPSDYITNKFYASEEEVGDQNLWEFVLTPVAGVSGAAYRPSEVSWDQLFTADPDTDFSGAEVYVRKDSTLHKFINNTGYDEIVNTRKPFLYLGRIYPGIREENTIRIETHHLKDFVLDALPIHQQNVNIREFIGVAFDMFYSSVYRRMKNSLSLSDPNETIDEYLRYLLETYNMTTIGSYASDRFFINNLPALLKRKGSYESLFAIWRLITHTTNLFNIYEHWHDELPTSASNIKEYCESNSITFDEHRYTGFYNGLVPSAGAGTRFYTEDELVDPIDVGLIQSPHYRVEVDLSDEPLEDNAILPETIARILLEKWESFRPVSRFAYYSSVLRLDTNFTGNSVDTYQGEYPAYALTKCYHPIYRFLPGMYIYYGETAEWSFRHGLNSEGIIIQCYKELGIETGNVTYERVMPASIVKTSLNTATVTFSVPVSGYAFVSSIVNNEGLISTHTDASSPIVTLSSEIDDLNQVFFNASNSEVIPSSYYIGEGGYATRTMTFGDTVSIHDVTIDAEPPVVILNTGSPLSVTHNLGTPAVQVDVYRNYNGEAMFYKVFPEKIEVYDMNTVRIYVQPEVCSYRIIVKRLSDWGYIFTKERLIGMFHDGIKIGHGETTKTYYPYTLSPSGSMQDEYINTAYTVKDIEVKFPEVVSDDVQYGYNIKIVIEANEDLNITEVGLFDVNNKLIFYTSCSPVFVIQGTTITLYYNISEETI